MAFSDEDIARHVGKTFNKGGVFGYAHVGVPSKDDPKVGATPHKAAWRQEMEKRFTMSENHSREHGSLMKPIRWARVSEVKE